MCFTRVTAERIQSGPLSRFFPTILPEKLQCGLRKWNIEEGASFKAGKRTRNIANTAANLRNTFLKDDWPSKTRKAVKFPATCVDVRLPVWQGLQWSYSLPYKRNRACLCFRHPSLAVPHSTWRRWNLSIRRRLQLIHCDCEGPAAFKNKEVEEALLDDKTRRRASEAKFDWYM